MVNVNTIKQEMEDDKLTIDKTCIEEDEINPYQNVVINKGYRKMPRQHKWNIGQFWVIWLNMFSMTKIQRHCITWTLRP